MHAVETVLLLVVLATVVATFARRIRVPAPSLLVVAGVVVAMIPGTPDVEVTPDLVSLVVLPPLLYAAGEELSWVELKRVWRPVTVLAIGVVLTSAVAVGAVAVWLTALPVGLAFVLGSVLASTDPVAVSALGRRLSLPGRLQALVQGESLFNDATSLILFRISVGIALAGAVSWGHVASEFVLLALGGSAIGGLTAAGAALVRSRTRDPVLETVVALVTPYVAYVVAESAHGSGVTAVVVAAITLGALRPRLTTPRSRLQLAAVYPTVIFLLESVVFSLIGLQLPTLVRELSAAGQSWILAAIVITAVLVVMRILWVLPIAAWAGRRVGDRSRRRVWSVTAVVAWAGTRGVVPLAAALSIPRTTADGQPLAGRDLVLVLAVAVIALSLVVQGFTLAAVVGRSGLAVPPSHVEEEAESARAQIDAAALGYLEQVAQQGTSSEAAIERARRALVRADSDRLDDGRDENVAYRQLCRDLIAVRADELNRLTVGHRISDKTRERLQHDLDLDDVRLDGA